MNEGSFPRAAALLPAPAAADGPAGNPATRHRTGRRLCVTALRQFCQCFAASVVLASRAGARFSARWT